MATATMAKSELALFNECFVDHFLKHNRGEFVQGPNEGTMAILGDEQWKHLIVESEPSGCTITLSRWPMIWFMMTGGRLNTRLCWHDKQLADRLKWMFANLNLDFPARSFEAWLRKAGWRHVCTDKKSCRRTQDGCLPLLRANRRFWVNLEKAGEAIANVKYWLNEILEFRLGERDRSSSAALRRIRYASCVVYVFTARLRWTSERTSPRP